MKPDPTGFNLRPIPLIGRGFGLPDQFLPSAKKASPHMTLAETLLKQLENPALSRDERAQLQCQMAADFEHKGQYESAREVLAELWQGVGERPALEGLSELTAAEVLLRAGTLSGWLASATQDREAQAVAKDLISESIIRFEALGELSRAANAQSDLGYCYWREGAYDEGRVVYGEAVKKLTEKDDPELRAKILIRSVMVESCSGRYTDALRLLTDSAELFEESTNDALKGKFHNDLALTLMFLGKAEHRPDYTDRAIIEYTAASHHFERAGHTNYRASAENNLGLLLHIVGRHDEAHEHLNAARRLFADLQNKGRIAQVDETRARVLLAQGKLHAAESAIRESVRVLSKGGEQGLLAEALTTQGRILSKIGNFIESANTLRRAADLAEQAGAVEDAGCALLSLIDEHANRINEHELLEAYERAHNLLKETQDMETISRLRACALRIVSDRRASLSPRRVRSLVDFWANFNLAERVHTYEARYVRRALIDGEGSVTRASRLLGFPHHGTLAAMLEPSLPSTWEKSKALAALNITEIPFELLDGNTQGYAKGRSIAVSPLAALPHKTLFHELAHVTLGHTAEGQTHDGQHTPRNLKEVEAEAVALILCETLQLSGAVYARGYLQSWLQDEAVPERSAQKIFHAADVIIKAGQ